MDNKIQYLKRIRLIENSKRLSNSLKSIANQYGFEGTAKITGLNVLSLAKKIGEYENYTAYDYYSIIYELFKKNKLEKSIGNYTFHFESFDGVLYWNYTGEKDSMDALCTPFWDGDFRIPIDINHYHNGKELIEINEYDYIKVTQRPKTIQEIISWFNNYYIYSVKHKLDEHLINLRRRF